MTRMTPGAMTRALALAGLVLTGAKPGWAQGAAGPAEAVSARMPENTMMVLLRGHQPSFRLVSVSRSGDWVLEISGAIIPEKFAHLEGMPGTIVKNVRVRQSRPGVVRITVVRQGEGEISFSRVPLGSGSFVIALTPHSGASVVPHDSTGVSPAARAPVSTRPAAGAAQERAPGVEVRLESAADRKAHAPFMDGSLAVDSVGAPGTGPGRGWVTRATSRMVQDRVGGADASATPALGLQAAYRDAASPLGSLSCHIRQEDRYNDGLQSDRSLLTGLAVVQPVLSFLHVFEGAQIQSTRPEGANADLRSRMYGGLGVLRPLPTEGLWYSLVSVDRVANESWASSYYAQSFRVGLKQPMPGALDVGVQGTIERVDPMVRSTPFFRAIGEMDVRLVQKTFEVGTRLVFVMPYLGGAEQNHAIIAPYLESSF